MRLGTLQLDLSIIDKETGAPPRGSKEGSRSRLDPEDSPSGSMNMHEQKGSETFIGNARASSRGNDEAKKLVNTSLELATLA